jgi:hypothetical protein
MAGQTKSPGCHFLLRLLIGLHHGGVIVFQVVVMLIDIKSTKNFTILFLGKIAKMSSPGRLVNNNITLSKMTLILSHLQKPLLIYHTYGF